MRKALVWKFALIAAVLFLTLVEIYPPDERLKPGLDLAGGTSLIYEIDTAGMKSQDTKGLADKMITVLRRRVDPDGVRNLVWRPLGNKRLEIQMPMASEEVRAKRSAYETALEALLAKNINEARVMRSLSKPSAERVADFNDFAAGSETAMGIFSGLADAFDVREAARSEVETFSKALDAPAKQIEKAGIDFEQVELSVGYWTTVDGNDRTDYIKAFLGDDLSDKKLALLEGYTASYEKWSKATDKLIDPEQGLNVLYQQAQMQLKELVLTEDELKQALVGSESAKNLAVSGLGEKYPDRVDEIKTAAVAYEGYRKYQGRLDDPKDLQRMLKGAGILEFRILPTIGEARSDTQLLESYVANLKEKGPRFASDDKYQWCLIEDVSEWIEIGENGLEGLKVRDKQGRSAVVAEFGSKAYVLASNKTDEVMLNRADKPWKLKNSRSTQDGQGRRAIGFSLDVAGGNMFRVVTGKNIERPLCILLDGMAISAPSISTQISGEGVITGRFTSEEISDMVDKLNAGSLPGRLIEQPISVKTIGPSIGADNRDQGVEAGIIGLIIVVLCMATYYRRAGAVADLALVLNVLVILAVMVVLQATFTLPGIAGLILTIGMSVDANVLIFERIREEQLKGGSLRIAIKNGYQKAFRTILDANITTFITAAILYWVAPEEVKGFAIVLMIGIITSMFTSLFATRAVFDFLCDSGVLKDKLNMWYLIHRPNVNWMALRPVFMTISIVLMVGGLFIFFSRDNLKNNKYDIEFTGGTAATIELKEPMDIQEVRDRIRKVGEEIDSPAIAAANVYRVGEEGNQFEINTTETNRAITDIRIAGPNEITADIVRARIAKAEDKVGERLRNLVVKADLADKSKFIVSTSQLNKSVVKEVLTKAFADAEISGTRVKGVVDAAILSAFENVLKVRLNLQLTITSVEPVTAELIEQTPELADYRGGVRITSTIANAATGAEIVRRFGDLRFKPETEDSEWYEYELLTTDLKEIDKNDNDTRIKSFVYVSVMPEAGVRELSQSEWKQFVESETIKVVTAGRLEESLPRVTQVSPSIGEEAKNQAMVAIVLSLAAIIIYVWVRFGNVRYGVAAIAALVHDVCITLGAVTVCTYIASTSIGQALLIEDFKISQVIIAAFLTLIGYSLNDTIVVFDRIRENRRKAQLVPATINDSINQTISRTIMTSFTTFVVVLIMYIFGGQSLRGFTFAIGLGIIIGTYSSIAIAAPLLLLGTKGKQTGSGQAQ